MKNRNYVVCRDNIYVGEVVKAFRIYRYEGESIFFGTKPGQLNVNFGRPYRSMLFTLDESKRANDLLYQSPNYPILNLTADETCLSSKNGIVINKVCSLGLLLEYYGYEKDLKWEDIIKIRETFFTGRFAKDHCELFGWKEVITGNSKSGRIFSSLKKAVFPEDYWDLLDDRGDKTLMDLAGYSDDGMGVFTPNQEEGPIKKLTMLKK